MTVERERPMIERTRRAIPFLERWRWVVWLLFTLAVAIGFDFKTPRAHFAELEAVDHTLALRADSLEAGQRRVERYLRALSVAQCIDRPRREWQMMGLPCDELLQGGVR